MNDGFYYVGGEVKFCDWVDPDHMSLFELDSLLIDMEFLANTGHTSMEEFRKCNGYSYYKRKHELPLREGLVELGEDQDVLDMALDACSKESNCEVYPIKREELNKAERIATICERPDSPEVRNNEMADDDFYEEGAEISEEEMEDGYIPVGSRHEYMNIDVEVPVEFDSDFGDSDYLESIHSSDEEERDGSSRVRLRYPEFNSQRDMDNPRFCVGLKYADFKDFKDVVKIWSINNKKPIKFAHSDARRVQVVCKTRHQNGCPWNIWVANTAEKKDVQIRACELKHEGCAPMSFKNKFADFHHIAKRYLERFQADPMWSSASIRKTVQEDLHLEISKWKAWKARRTTMDLIRGKGLMNALQKLVPYAEHKFCVRHLWTNLQRAHGCNKKTKKLLWSAARSSYQVELTRNMSALQEHNLTAYRWLQEKPFSQWTRSHLLTFSKSEV
ncbi:hypothetical protein LINPERHAP1_LOCUS21090 [Linum perenne]